MKELTTKDSHYLLDFDFDVKDGSIINSHAYGYLENKCIWGISYQVRYFGSCIQWWRAGQPLACLTFENDEGRAEPTIWFYYRGKAYPQPLKDWLQFSGSEYKRKRCMMVGQTYCIWKKHADGISLKSPTGWKLATATISDSGVILRVDATAKNLLDSCVVATTLILCPIRMYKEELWFKPKPQPKSR